MHRASERANRPTRTGARTKSWGAIAALLALVLLLAACQTAPPEPAPAAEPEFDMELELALLNLPVNEQFRVRFLPPLARSMPTGDFVADMPLEIRFFNVNPGTGTASGATLGSALSTSRGSIASHRGNFSTIWFSFSMLFERKATEYLRAEVRLPGGPNAPVCNEASEHCLGYLDIYMFKGLWLGRQKVPEGFVPVPAVLGVLPITFKVLAEQAPPADDPPPATIGELQGVAGGTLDGGTQAPNCVSPFSSRPGQGLQRVGAGLQRVGAIGGLLVVDTSQFDGSLIAPGQVGTELRGEVPAISEVRRPAVVLIVDDFGAGYELPAGIFTSGSPISDYEGQISHGALVLHHLRELGETLYPGHHWVEGVGANGQPVWSRGETYDPGEGHVQHRFLHLQVVDVGSSSTDDVPSAILSAIEYWAALGIEDLVVNMSFAIVPCALAQDYDAAAELPALNIDTFEKYVAALAEVNGIGEQYLAELDELVSIPANVSNDPLLKFTACPITTPGLLCDGSPDGGGEDGEGGGEGGLFYKLFFVAASGNYGGGYALYPAAAPHVIGVGSVEHVGNSFQVSDYSNTAWLAAPGDLFILPTVNGEVVAYTGTSFAAPAVSVFLAFDAMSGPERCNRPDVALGAPPDIAEGDYGEGAQPMLPFYTLDGTDSALLIHCLGAD